MTVLFCFRLTSAVDSRLRRHLSRRGQLATLIVLILNTIDLMTVPVLELGSDFEEPVVTSAKLPAALHADLKRIARLRGSSMSALMNSAIWSYTEEMSKKDGRRRSARVVARIPPRCSRPAEEKTELRTRFLCADMQHIVPPTPVSRDDPFRAAKVSSMGKEPGTSGTGPIKDCSGSVENFVDDARRKKT
jgi:hypothetical protein